MRQLVGCSCAICQGRIGSILEGLFCADCGNPVHRACLGTPSDVAGKCKTCGGDITNLSAAQVRMPAPLGDPLRRIRTYLAWSMGLQILLIFVTVAWVRVSWVLAQAFLLLMMLLLWSILPFRVTNALYLRSFRKDPRTKLLRRIAQAALGPDFRLSGVRDPRRHWPSFFRMAWNTVFLFQYNSPRFMNLEAGADWFGRLWRSLEHSRCVMIDVSDITDAVLDEIGLCYFALGLERILFVGHDSRSNDDWRKSLAGWLPPDPDCDLSKINLAIWGRGIERRRTFREAIRSFARNLSPPPQLVWDGDVPRIGRQGLPYSPVPPADEGVGAALGYMFAVAYAIAVGLGLRQDPKEPLAVGGLLVLLLPGVLALGCLVVTSLLFVIDCLSVWGKIVGGIFFLMFLVLFAGFVAFEVWGVVFALSR
jgi:hypothetical protein